MVGGREGPDEGRGPRRSSRGRRCQRLTQVFTSNEGDSLNELAARHGDDRAHDHPQRIGRRRSSSRPPTTRATPPGDEADIRMTKQEVKEEFKQNEGNPEVRQAIRSRQAAISRNRMIGLVSKADVVVVNPTHYAGRAEVRGVEGRATGGGEGRGRARGAHQERSREARRPDRARTGAHARARTAPATSARSSRSSCTKRSRTCSRSCSACARRARRRATTSSRTPQPRCNSSPGPLRATSRGRAGLTVPRGMGTSQRHVGGARFTYTVDALRVAVGSAANDATHAEPAWRRLLAVVLAMRKEPVFIEVSVRPGPFR